MEPNEPDNNKANVSPAPESVPKSTPEFAPKSTPESAPASIPSTPEVTMVNAASDSNSITKESNNKTGLFIGLGVGIVAIIGIVAAAILIPQTMTPDYNIMFDSASNLSDELSNYFYSSACNDVRRNVDNYYSVTNDEYTEFINQCGQDAENLYAAIVKFEAESGVGRDQEISELYQRFKKLFDEKAPAKDKLENTLKIHEAVHRFAVEMDKIDDDYESMPDPSEFKKVAAILIESGDEALKTFAEGLSERYDTLYKASQELLNVNYSDPNYQSVHDAYWDASDDFSDFYYEQSDIIDDIDYPLADSFSDDEEGDVMDAFNDLETAILNKLK